MKEQLGWDPVPPYGTPRRERQVFAKSVKSERIRDYGGESAAVVLRNLPDSRVRISALGACPVRASGILLSCAPPPVLFPRDRLW